jgi:hypothetical protein
MTDNSDFAASVLALPPRSQPFKPFAIYDKDGDSLELFLSDEDYRAERVDHLITVYISQETDRIVGSLIKGVSRIEKDLQTRMPGFSISIVAGKVRIDHLFLASMWSIPDLPLAQRVIYQRIAQEAERYAVQAEFCGTK